MNVEKYMPSVIIQGCNLNQNSPSSRLVTPGSILLQGWSCPWYEKQSILRRSTGVNIARLRSIEEVDACVEEKTGVKLNVVAASSSITDRDGNVLNVKSYDIDGLVETALR